MTPTGGSRGPALLFLAVVLETAAAEWGWRPEETLREPVGRTMALMDARLARHGHRPPPRTLGLEQILKRHGIDC